MNEMILVIPIKHQVNKITGHLSDTAHQKVSSSLSTSTIPADDPIFHLGKHPIDDTLKDASIDHDK